jgi:DNA ligase-1
MLLADVARTSRDAAATRSRNAKTALLARLLRALTDGERGVVVRWLSGTPGRGAQGRIGVGYASVREALAAPPAAAASLAVADVHAALGAYAAARGPGSGNARRALLADLFARAVPEERDFLAGLLTGELRQGALEGLLAEAVAQAAGAPPDDVRRAAMLAGSLPDVAEAVLGEGPAALARYRLRVLAPVQPMLAQTGEDVADALARLGPAALEWKLDGARVQVHRDGDAVRIFSRTGRDVTSALPEVAAVVRAAPARALVLDGEALAMRADGTPEPFQRTMRRFGRKLAPEDADGDAVELDPERIAPGLPLTAFFFDLLHRDGVDLLQASNAERRAALEAVIPPAHLVPRAVPRDRAEAEAFFEDALARGHEGVVAKALAAPYEAGRRGGAWLKVKRAHTLDLVVLAVEPGSGRRRGWLSNLHLGARDPATGGFVMLGKTFKGMTDAMLAWQTARLRALAVADEGHVVRVRPELVVEVAFDGLQASSRYEGGLALRFARVKRYREDKRPEDADTIETVRAIYAGATGAASDDGRASSATHPASVRT